MSIVPTRISDCDSHSTALRNFLFLLTLVFALHWPSLHWETLIETLSQPPIAFRQKEKRILRFITLLFTILVLIGIVLVII